jgi:hypothetical protein
MTLCEIWKEPEKVKIKSRLIDSIDVKLFMNYRFHSRGVVLQQRSLKVAEFSGIQNDRPVCRYWELEL